MPETGTVSTPQTIPNASLPVHGVPGSRATFFLRSTPPVFTVISAGGSNQNFSFRAYRAFEYAPRMLGSRVYQGARPSGLLIEFQAAIAGVGTVVAAISRTQLLAASITGAGTVVSDFIRPLRAFFASIAGTGTVVADQSGGTVGGLLALTPEDPSDALTLSEETGDSLTLTPEDPSDSLPLTPG